VEQILLKQNEYFRSGATRPIPFRIKQLERLREAVQVFEKKLTHALLTDLGKSEFEAYSTEIGYVLYSIEHTVKHLEKWSKEPSIRLPFYLQPGTGEVKYDPYGAVLIIAPFNYPFQLLIEPLIGALSAGNTAVLKPSDYTPSVEKVVKEMIEAYFEPEYVAVVTGGRDVNEALLKMRFDYIFFTGSPNVGKVVMKAAAENLIPVTLELGGKSPAIVHKDANLKVAALRIAWGKFSNAGQTCIAPDYVYVHKEVSEAFKAHLLETILEFYGPLPIQSPDYGRIVNEKAMHRLIGLIDHDKVIHGGQYDLTHKYIAPTVMTEVTWSDQVMQEEIFGPILPILTYDSLEQVIDTVSRGEKPLALYLFSEDQLVQDYVVDNIRFGGGCINDTLMHVATPFLPFGGVGHSGMGSYHGKESFETFTHKKTILKRSTKLSNHLTYPPYKNKVSLIKKILK